MLKEGTRVKVFLPTSEQTISMAMRAFHGKISRVKSARHYSKYNKNAYTLEGCRSDFNNDYEFFEEWLISIGESEE